MEVLSQEKGIHFRPGDAEETVGSEPCLLAVSISAAIELR